MRSRILLATLTASALLLAAAVGCQTYDFEPVQPLVIAQTTQSYTVVARAFKPNLALLVDKSGSMNFAVDYSDPDCTAQCGQTGQPACGAGCPTRWQDLRAAMATFLTQSGTIARMGLSFYPSVGAADSCAPANRFDAPLSTSSDVPAELQAKADEIRNLILSTTPRGGTPTGASINFVGAAPELSADDLRKDFILLLTDGLPNCNANNANDFTVDPTACRCTEAPSVCMAFPKILCLDKDATVAAISAQRAKNIRTIVVGFGAETSAGDGPETLQAMAEAGGFPRECPGGTNAECGTGTCDTATKTCSTKFFQARDANELARVLEAIAGSINVRPCDYDLSQTPSDPAFLSVLVNGQPVARGASTWEYRPPGAAGAGQFGTVGLLGALCDQAKASTNEAPFQIEIRLLQSL